MWAEAPEAPGSGSLEAFIRRSSSIVMPDCSAEARRWGCRVEDAAKRNLFLPHEIHHHGNLLLLARRLLQRLVKGCPRTTRNSTGLDARSFFVLYFPVNSQIVRVRAMTCLVGYPVGNKSYCQSRLFFFECQKSGGYGQWSTCADCVSSVVGDCVFVNARWCGSM